MPSEQQIACPKCKEMINKGAKKCPHCHSDVRSWLSRHPIISGFIIFFIVMSIISQLTKDTSKISQPVVNNNEKLSTYELMSEKTYDGKKNIDVFTEEKNNDELIKINNKLVNDNPGFDLLWVRYFDDKSVASNYFTKALDASISEKVKNEMFSHYVADYKSTTKQLNINKNNEWVSIKNYE